MITLQTPYVQFTELDGSPLDDGAVYIGTAGLNPQTNPTTVYWDNAGTQPAAQPLSTRSGVIARNGAPARVYISASSYSLMVRDKQGRLVASELTISASVDASGITDGTIAEVKLDAALVAKINGALQKSGGTMTGAIVLPGNASSALEAVPLQQLGSASAFSFSALTLSATGANANVAITANEILLRAASGAAHVMSSVSLTINTASTGANGLDTGTLSISTWYAVWVIWNGTTTAGLISLSATAPTLPSGYTHKARVGWIRTDSTVNKYPLAFNQKGSRAQYALSGALTAYPQMFFGTTSGAQAVAVGSFCPTTAGAIAVTWGVAGTGSGAAIAIGPSAAAVVATSSSFAYIASSSTSFSGINNCSMILESSNIYVNSSNGNGFIGCTGWEDNL